MAHEKNTRKKGGVGKILLVLVVLLALAVGGALLFAHNEISGNGRPGTEVTVSIPQGSGVSVIAQKLKDAGVIRSAYLFRWYVGQKGAASKLQYGDFTLQKSACSYDAIIAVLSTYAKAETVRVTIPEGTTAIAIAQKMEAAGLCSAEDFLKEANEGRFQRIHLLAVRAGRCRRAGSLYEVRGLSLPGNLRIFKGRHRAQLCSHLLCPVRCTDHR